jgi:hypothetical protein
VFHGTPGLAAKDSSTLSSQIKLRPLFIPVTPLFPAHRK